MDDGSLTLEDDDRREHYRDTTCSSVDPAVQRCFPQRHAALAPADRVGDVLSCGCVMGTIDVASPRVNPPAR